MDATHIIYIIDVEYDQSPAVLTLCYTDPLPDVGFSLPVLTPGGNLAMVGGRQETNFQPFASAIIFKVGDSKETLSASGFPWWWMMLAAGVLVLALIAYMSYRFYKAHESQEESDEPGTLDNGEMMERIIRLMEKQQLFLNPDLKVADVAVALGTHSRTVSDCIKATYDCSFSQFVNNYRVEHVKNLMADHPGKKIHELYIAAGFASETSFFRTFKQITGMTPREWISENRLSTEP